MDAIGGGGSLESIRYSGPADDVESDAGVADDSAGVESEPEIPTSTDDSVDLSADSGGGMETDDAGASSLLGSFSDNFARPPVDEAGAPPAGSPNTDSPAGGAPAPAAQPDPYFKYAGVPWKDHSASIGWQPGSNRESPTQANQAITNGYMDLNKAMQDYLKGDPNGPKLPPLADWSTFGKYASREAGEQIRNLEDAQRAKSGDLEAARRLQKNTTNLESIGQAAALTGDALGHQLGDVKPLDAALNPLGEAGKVAGGTVGDMAFTTPGTMLDALVRGNNGIYNNFAPAYDAFLKGESDGSGGMEALKKAGYYPGSESDPQGFISNSLAKYQEARDLGLQAQQETDPAERDKLLQQRKDLVANANLNLGNQEQIEVIQQPGVFGNPEVAQRIGALGGTMSVHDANGATPLLPNGGNWADFATRMGYKDVPPGTDGEMNIRHPNGDVHNYAVDPTQKGTIADYFTQNLEGSRAAKLNDSNPAPLYAPTTTNSGVQADGLARDLNRGNYADALGKAGSLPVIAGGDLAAYGGDQIAQAGTREAVTGAVRMANAYRRGEPMNFVRGSAELGVGAVVNTGGRVLHSAGENLSFAGQVMGTMWDMVRGK